MVPRGGQQRSAGRAQGREGCSEEGCCVGPNRGSRSNSGARVTLSSCYGEPTKKMGSRLSHHLVSSMGRSHKCQKTGLGGRELVLWRGAVHPSCHLLQPPFPASSRHGDSPPGGKGLGRESNVTKTRFPSITRPPSGEASCLPHLARCTLADFSAWLSCSDLPCKKKQGKWGESTHPGQ